MWTLTKMCECSVESCVNIFDAQFLSRLVWRCSPQATDGTEDGDKDTEDDAEP